MIAFAAVTALSYSLRLFAQNLAQAKTTAKNNLNNLTSINNAQKDALTHSIDGATTCSLVVTCDVACVIVFGSIVGFDV
jgi:hypothetical protein